MKVKAYIFLFSLAMLGSYPLIQHLQVPLEQALSESASCCCDQTQESCCDEGTESDEEKSDTCDTGCDCACQFHLNAVHFQFTNFQLAEEQEYHYGEYVNSYSFEYLSMHIPPPRLG